ncbi:MAG: VOC family protein [Gammaproteobacteria bacterium]|nr:VOC family protein [Gammaproteobacteria bacterium]
MQKITPFLWFDHEAEEAAKFYVSVFANSRILKTVRYSGAGPGPAGSVLTVAFELNGVQFTALNGGPQHQFSEAISFVVNCHSQAEVDTVWEKLSAGGRTDRCGWLKDRFGLSWQVVPTVLPALLGDPDPVRAQRTMQAMLKMDKLDIAALERAHAGGA